MISVYHKRHEDLVNFFKMERDLVACTDIDGLDANTQYLFQNNYQQDDTYGLSFISGLVVIHSTCFELQGAHHQEFTFFTVQAVSGILCNLLLYSTRSPTCSVPDT